MDIFPRKITDLLPYIDKYVSKRYLAFYVRDFFVILLILVAGIQLLVLVSLNSRLLVEKYLYELKIDDYRYWSSVALEFPAIPDVLYNAAVSASTAGEKGRAIAYLDKALAIDPLFDKAKVLRQEMLED